MNTQTKKQNNDVKRKLALEALHTLQTIDDTGESIKEACVSVEKVVNGYYREMMKARNTDIALPMNFFSDEVGEEGMRLSMGVCYLSTIQAPEMRKLVGEEVRCKSGIFGS